MANIKVEQSKLGYLSKGEMWNLGKNLLDGITPEITTLSNEPFVCELEKEQNLSFLSIITDDQNISTHVDLFGAPLSLTYDLGKVCEIDTIHLSGFERYVFSGFKLFASKDREDLYNPENLFCDYHRVDNDDMQDKDFVYTVSGSLRYFGFMATEACLRDEILRIARIALCSDFNTKQHRMTERSTCNLIEKIVPQITGNFAGNPDFVCNNIAFDKSTMLTAAEDITLTYRSNIALDINKLYFVGNNIEIFELICDGKSVDFTSSEEDTYYDEKILILSADIRCKELKIKVAEGSVIDLVFSNTNIRRASVDFDSVVCPDFIGTGTNVIPTFFSDMGVKGGANEVFWEMEKHHIQKAKPHCARMWFQIDWITDNEKDYYNRKYTFDSDTMQSVKRYLEVCRDNGVEVLFNFGWKVSYKIHDWFPVGGIAEVYPNSLRQAAPKDLKQYAIALADTLEHLILECGFDNIKHVTFYNEPRFEANNIISDFAVQGDKIAYWASMLRYAKYYVDNSKVSGMVDFWGAEEDYNWQEWTEGLNTLASECFSTHTVHRYNLSYNDICKLYTEDLIPYLNGKQAILSEYGNCHRACMNWDTNHVNNILAGANIGVSGAFNWILSDCPLVDPLNWWHRSDGNMDKSFSMWDFLPKADNLNDTAEIFYETSLWAHYVPNHSKSVKAIHDYKYSDNRICAFKSDDDYTICVENKGDNNKTEIKIDLGVNLNKKFYKYVYRRRTDGGEGNLAVPHAEAIIEVTSTLCDTLSEGYEFAVYSTIPPIRQVLMSECDIRAKAGDKVELSAKVLGCETKPTWSISQSLMEGATLVGSTVEIPTSAKTGEMLAVKALLPTGEFGISIIRII